MRIDRYGDYDFKEFESLLGPKNGTLYSLFVQGLNFDTALNSIGQSLQKKGYEIVDIKIGDSGGAMMALFIYK